MASVTLHPDPQRIPIGATVNAYLQSGWSQAARPPAGDPVGVSAASGTIGTDGSVTLTGLADGTAYFLHTDVSGDDRYVAFSTAAATTDMATQAELDAAALAAVAKALVDAKGDLLAGTAADTIARLAVGANDTVLTADSAEATGVKWSPPLAGSSSGGSNVHLDPFLGPDGQTNWSTVFFTSTRFHGAFIYSTGAVANDEMYWDVYLAAGTFKFKMLHEKDTDRGIYSIQIDGVEVGTIDGYAASSTSNVQTTVTGIVVATAGLKRLKLKMATKNASSSGYRGSIQAAALRRTA